MTIDEVLVRGHDFRIVNILLEDRFFVVRTTRYLIENVIPYVERHILFVVAATTAAVVTFSEHTLKETAGYGCSTCRDQQQELNDGSNR